MSDPVFPVPHPFPHPHINDPEYDHRVSSAETKSFWIVCAISNPIRFKTRYALYRKFRHHVLHELKTNLVTVECAEGERDFQVTGDRHKPVYEKSSAGQLVEVQLKRSSVTWNKEELMNIGFGRLPLDAKYVMFCDADITFCNKDIVTETIHALQMHRVVQPFESCADLGPDGQVMQIHKSFGWCHAKGLKWKHTPTLPGEAQHAYSYDDPPKCGGKGGMGEMGIPWHPGFCMAFRKSVIDKMGGLLDVGILGASDHHMFGAMIGKAKLTYPAGIHINYSSEVLDWERKAAKIIKQDISYVKGTILHSFHGSKKTRYYASRWDVLLENNFDPQNDLRRTPSGIRELISGRIGLRDGILRYFKSRNEDNISMD